MTRAHRLAWKKADLVKVGGLLQNNSQNKHAAYNLSTINLTRMSSDAEIDYQQSIRGVHDMQDAIHLILASSDGEIAGQSGVSLGGSSPNGYGSEAKMMKIR